MSQIIDAYEKFAYRYQRHGMATLYCLRCWGHKSVHNSGLCLSCREWFEKYDNEEFVELKE